MQREVWFVTVDEGGNALSRGGRVCLPDGARVAHFRDALKDACPNRLASVDAIQLQVYASRAAFDAQTPPLEPKNVLKAEWGTVAEDLVVVVPTVVDATPELVMKKQKTIWESSTPAPPTVQRLATNGSILKLSVEQIAGFDVREASFHDGILLFCRDSVIALFEFLEDGVLTKSKLGWILGPPGSGKFVAAAAFALSLDQSRWTVTWISVARGKAPPHCVRLEVNCKKTVSLKHPADMAKLLEQVSDISKKRAVFLDGLIPSRHDDEQVECLKWLEADRENRRLVIASSIAIRGENTEVADDLLGVEEYFLFSWTLDKYLEATRNDDLFASVKSNLDACTPLPASTADPALQLTREALVRAKHYFAGDNARWMFAFNVAHVVTLVNSTAIKRFGDVVSRDACPESTEWMLEMYLFAWLRKANVTLVAEDGSDVQWRKAPICVTSSSALPPLNTDGIWIKPPVWSEGGYNAVYLDKAQRLVRFVLMTPTRKPTFHIESFYGFLQDLQQSFQSFEVEKLEIFFVVDLETLCQDFKIETVSGEGLLSEFGWGCGEEKEHINVVGIEGPEWWSDLEW